MNLATALTLLRIAATLPLVYFLLQLDTVSQIIAAVIFALAALLDALDGYVARKFNQVTELGKFLDPVADKLLVLSALAVMTAQNRAPMLALLLIVAREVLVTNLRTQRLKKSLEVAADKTGKFKAVIQMLAILMLILNLPYAVWVLWVSVVLTLYSGMNYLKVYFCIL